MILSTDWCHTLIKSKDVIFRFLFIKLKVKRRKLWSLIKERPGKYSLVHFTVNHDVGSRIFISKNK